MKNNNGYLHITYEFIQKVGIDFEDKAFLMKSIQDFFEWGGDVLLSHNNAISSDQCLKDIVEIYCADEGTCFNSVLVEDNEDIFVVWDVTTYLKTNVDKQHITKALNIFVSRGGIVKIDDQYYTDVYDLNNYLKNN